MLVICVCCHALAVLGKNDGPERREQAPRVANHEEGRKWIIALTSDDGLESGEQAPRADHAEGRKGRIREALQWRLVSRRGRRCQAVQPL